MLAWAQQSAFNGRWSSSSGNLSYIQYSSPHDQMANEKDHVALYGTIWFPMKLFTGASLAVRLVQRWKTRLAALVDALGLLLIFKPASGLSRDRFFLCIKYQRKYAFERKQRVWLQEWAVDQRYRLFWLRLCWQCCITWAGCNSWPAAFTGCWNFIFGPYCNSDENYLCVDIALNALLCEFAIGPIDTAQFQPVGSNSGLLHYCLLLSLLLYNSTVGGPHGVSAMSYTVLKP